MDLLADAISPGASEIGKIEVNPPKATFSWEQHAALQDDLTFGAMQETFSLSLDAKDLFDVTLPTFVVPTWPYAV